MRCDKPIFEGATLELFREWDPKSSRKAGFSHCRRIERQLLYCPWRGAAFSRTVADASVRASICAMPSAWLYRAPVVYFSLHPFPSPCWDRLSGSSGNSIADRHRPNVRIRRPSRTSFRTCLFPRRDRRRLGKLRNAEAMGLLKNPVIRARRLPLNNCES
jgi:hypothetical protein